MMGFFNYDNPPKSLLYWRIGMARTIGFGALIFFLAETTGFWPDYEVGFLSIVILATVYHYARYVMDKRKESKHRNANGEE